MQLAGPAGRAPMIAIHSPPAAFHPAAGHPATGPRVRPNLAGNPHDQALPDAMDDERQLPGPLQAMIDDAYKIDADPRRLRQLLARLRTRLASHLAHEEADALPLISPFLSPGESPGVRERVLSQLPAPARLLYRTVWLPRHARTTPPP
jgi:hypothetical protein